MIETAEIAFSPEGIPWSAAFGDIYHTSDGGLGQVEHVFMAGNDLPLRWRGRDSFTILETGFGLGLSFLATWHAWRHDPQRGDKLRFISVEKYPFAPADLERLHRNWPQFAELSAQPVCRVVVVSPDESDGDFLSLVDRIGLTQVSYAVGWSAWLDIAPQGVDKSTALERVRTWLGIEPDRVLVMGDGRNDVEMFRWAQAHGGRAVAMGQGPDEVRREAGETTASVHSGGVADVLRAL